MTGIETASLADVRALIAAAILRDETVGEQLGEIALRPHQTRAASRLSSIIASSGGAMLAEPVGVGKTYTALAVAAQRGEAILVVAPASLKSMWNDAARRCGLEITLISHEALSRGARPTEAAPFVIVDEAHRFRTPTTRRYELLADLCRHARILLVTATPVHNAQFDLATQLALFLGRSAWKMSEEELVRYVVRDNGSALGARPRLEGPHRVELGLDDDCLDLLLALPAPVPAKDESVAVALLMYGLLHQWTSSRAALVAALERRKARGLALSAAVDAGRQPTKAELAAWSHAGDALQLAFPEIMAADTIEDVDANTLLVAIDRHGAAIDRLLEHLRRTPDPDVERANALRRIRREHPGERIIAFCHYAETVRSLRSLLMRDAGIAFVTAAGARVASGSISKDAVLEQFSPRADGGHVTSNAATHIGLLITTDLLSEGLNLQEASVIVHLDLPWNPARLDQRVGRALRLGSRHQVVTVYAVAPPASVERLVRIESRLRDKLSVAERTIGIAGRILPPIVSTPFRPDPERTGLGLAEQRGAFEAELRAWSHDGCSIRVTRGCVVAGVAAETRGFLGLVWTTHGALLAADVGSGIDTSASSVTRAIAACAGAEAPIDPGRVTIAMEQMTKWLAARRGSMTVNLNAASAARTRRATLTRVAQTLARAPRHQRSTIAPLAHAARAVASVPLGEGAERILETLVQADLPDVAWLRSIAAFGELNARPAPPDDNDAEVTAMILFG